MAKWGEGDPRWLVEDRPDATNVNNWHWTEKNASRWSKGCLSELLVGLKIENEYGKCEITEMTKCEGDAAVNNRKAKLIFFYEWAIELKWKGSLRNQDCTVNGTLEILNLSEEHEIKDVDINVNVENNSEDADVLKELMRTKGTEIVRQCLSSYLKSLKEEFSKGVILPTKESSNVASKPRQSVDIKKAKNLENSPAVRSTAPSCLETVDLRYTENFKCQAEEFYRVMTVPEMAQIFTQGSCVLNPVVGGKFEFYSGNVHGYFTELVPNKLIKQKWRCKSWPKDHFSDVTIEIQERSDCTVIDFEQTEIPKSELENTSEGWKNFYWESIKRTFGFGAILF